MQHTPQIGRRSKRTSISSSPSSRTSVPVLAITRFSFCFNGDSPRINDGSLLCAPSMMTTSRPLVGATGDMQTPAVLGQSVSPGSETHAAASSARQRVADWSSLIIRVKPVGQQCSATGHHPRKTISEHHIGAQPSRRSLLNQYSPVRTTP